MNLDALEARAEAMEDSWGAESQWIQPEEVKAILAEVRRLRDGMKNIAAGAPEWAATIALGYLGETQEEGPAT